MSGKRVFVGRVRVADVVAALSYFLVKYPLPREAVEHLFVDPGVLTPGDISEAYDRAATFAIFLRKTGALL